MPIVADHGQYYSQALGLEIQVDADRLRFYAGTALLLESEDLIARLQDMVDHAQQRADEEARRREAAEQEIERLRAELDRLKR